MGSLPSIHFCARSHAPPEKWLFSRNRLAYHLSIMKRPFVHLHFHTCYSLLDGACHVDRTMEMARELKMPAIAITDHGVMYGIVDFYKAAKDAGIKPILGCEMYVARESRIEKRAENQGNPLNHLVLLATDYTGYENLSRLVSLAHIEGFYYKPRIDKALLARHAKGLIALSACLKGEVASHLEDGNVPASIKAAGEYADLFGKDRFFLEFQDHGLPEQRQVNRLLAEVARKAGVEIVATNDVHYLRREHAEAHEVLLCLQTQTVMSDPKRMRYRTNEFYMRSGEEMAKLAAEFPGAVERTADIAERCNVEIPFGQLHFPVFDVPDGLTQKEYLTRLGHEGIARIYGVADPARPANDREREILARLDSEMAVIEKTGFLNYFLVVWDFVRFAHEQKIPVGPGRGSGGGSLIAYALGITAIDPLRYSLIFERFLNPERVSPPDFDIDFCQARRGEVIEYVRRRYGRENVAQIVTFGSLGPKTVVRDVGRVLEVPFARCDQIAKLIPEDPKATLKSSLNDVPDFRKAYETDPDCKRILDYGFVLEGLYRNTGTHAAGVVIGERPLIDILPLCRDKNEEVITQYDMEAVGKVGLLKMDFLGLKTLTVIQETVDLVAATRERRLDVENLPLDDPATCALFNRGDTVGVFQLESTGMRDLIRRIGISHIEDLIAMIALYRPGPMNMLPDYVDRKTGKAQVAYDHPLLEPILKETYGVMVYQEQVQKAANVLAGYSLGAADELRRAMGKKKPEEMAKQRDRFVKGCHDLHKIPKEKAGQIFDNMERFAGYGFNKAHSAGYAIIAYQTAFLKANYPAEFLSALLSSEIGNFDKIPVFIGEAETVGLKVLPPDINASGARFRPEGERGVRYGLAGIKNVGEGAAQTVAAERERGGPFKGLVDFCSRIDGQAVNRKVIESLVRCGAFDSVGPHRARLFNAIEFAMARAASAARDRRSGQTSLFSLMGDAEQPAEAPLPECAPWHESEMLAAERELLGMYMSGHPLAQQAWLLKHYALTTVSRLAELQENTQTRVGGIVAQIARRVTKDGRNWAIVTLEDLEGSIEAFAFAETLERYGGALAPDTAVLLCGTVSRRNDKLNLLIAEAYPLQEAPRLFTRRISIHIPVSRMDDGMLERVHGVLGPCPGETPVAFCLEFPGGEKVFIEADRPFRVLPGESLVRRLEHEVGEHGVFVDVDKTPCKRPPSRNGRYSQRSVHAEAT
jgi:DNA polymerase-3 subunit alpha